MNENPRESIYAFLRRQGALERVIGKESERRKQEGQPEQYANRLILESDRLLHVPTDREEFFSLKAGAERAFAADHSWAHALCHSAHGEASEWEQYRAKQLGECFMRYFPDVYEGLPLYVTDGDAFRLATSHDDSYARVMAMVEGDWPQLSVSDDPPAWAQSLFIKRSDLYLHQQFFGDFGYFQDHDRISAARQLRKEAFRRALALQQSQVQQQVLGRHLHYLTEVMPKLRNILELSGDQAILFIQEAFQRLPVTLYRERSSSGFWTPCGSDQVNQALEDLKASDYAMDFHNGDLKPREEEKWRDLRLTTQDMDAILEDARRFADMRPASATVSKKRLPNPSEAKYLDPDHLNYSPKLVAAISAWQALAADPSLVGKRHPKKAAAIWLKQHAGRLGLLKNDGSLNAQGLEDISKVVNWKPEGGAPKSGG